MAMVIDKNSSKIQTKYSRMAFGKNVLELGGGNGEFVSLCEDKVASILSIDSQPTSEKVRKSDIISFLKKNKKKFNFIYARHVVEHFHPKKLEEILKLVYKAMTAGGEFVMILPNMKNPNVATYYFWGDFEHARPYSDIGLIYKLEGIGFKIVKQGPDKDSWDNAWYKNIVRKIRSIITGLPSEAPDLCIISRKP